MSTQPLDLSKGPLLGRVMRIDPSRAEVELSDPGLTVRVTVTDLVALRTGDPAEFLIGLVEGVTRGSAAEPDGAAPDASPTAQHSTRPVVQVMLIGTLRHAEGGGRDAFRRGAGTFPHVGADCHLVEGELLRGFMTILGDDVAPEERLALGHFVADREAAAIADGNRLFQRHVALLGSTGAGKSWAVALMLERAARLGNANLIVFDMHGEYAPLAESHNGAPFARSLRIAGPGDLAGEDDDVLFLPYWLLDRDEMLSLTLDLTDPDASDQAMRFANHVHRLKESTLREAGRQDVIETFTVDSPVPYQLSQLINWLKADDTERIVRQPSGRVVNGPYTGRLSGFITRLEARVADHRYGFMFSPPDAALDFDWLTKTATSLLQAGQGGTGIKVIDFSEVPADILPVVVGVLARLIYDVQFWMDGEGRTPVCFICDEAHVYLPAREESGPVHRAALHAFEEIAKEGRKYGVGLLVVSQRPADVSRTILSQCNNFIVMRLTNDQDQRVVNRLLPETLAGVTGILPLLDVGEAVVLGDAVLVPTRLKFDPPAVQPASATRDFWSDWATRPSSAEAIAAGVEGLRCQVRRSGWEHQLGAFGIPALARRALGRPAAAPYGDGLQPPDEG